MWHGVYIDLLPFDTITRRTRCTACMPHSRCGNYLKVDGLDLQVLLASDIFGSHVCNGFLDPYFPCVKTSLTATLQLIALAIRLAIALRSL